jgi:hypothetical protein
MNVLEKPTGILLAFEILVYGGHIVKQMFVSSPDFKRSCLLVSNLFEGVKCRWIGRGEIEPVPEREG